MSGKAVGWAMEQVTGSPVTKLVLLKLADNANDNGVAYPSLNLIVLHTELSKRTVIDHLEKLETLQLIKIERNEVDGLHVVNRYFLNMPLPEKPVAAKPARPAHHKGSNGAQPVVAARDVLDNGSSDAPAGGSVAATPVVNLAHDEGSEPATPLVQDAHQGGVAGAGGGVAGAGGSVADANPPAPPIKINPQTNPQREPAPKTGARATLPLEAKPVDADDPPEFLRRYTPDFEAFWDAYPTCVNASKLKAFEAWKKCAKHRPALHLLLDCVAAYADAIEVDNRKRRPNDQRPVAHPSTWLNEARWESYLAGIAAKAAADIARDTTPPWGGHPVAAQLLDEIGPDHFDTWLRPCILAINDGVPMLTAPSRLIRDRVAADYIDRIEDAFGTTVVLQ